MEAGAGSQVNFKFNKSDQTLDAIEDNDGLDKNAGIVVPMLEIWLC